MCRHRLRYRLLAATLDENCQTTNTMNHLIHKTQPPTFDVFDQRQHEYYMGQSPLLQRKASIHIEADESDPLFDLGQIQEKQPYIVLKPSIFEQKSPGQLIQSHSMPQNLSPRMISSKSTEQLQNQLDNSGQRAQEIEEDPNQRHKYRSLALARKKHLFGESPNLERKYSINQNFFTGQTVVDMEMEEPQSPMKVQSVSGSEQDETQKKENWQKKRFIEIMRKHNLSAVAFCGNEGDFIQDGGINPALLKYDDDQPWFDKISEQGLKNLFSGKLDRMPNSYTYEHLKNVDFEALFKEEDGLDVNPNKKQRKNSIDQNKSPDELPKWLRNVSQNAEQKQANNDPFKMQQDLEVHTDFETIFDQIKKNPLLNRQGPNLNKMIERKLKISPVPGSPGLSSLEKRKFQRLQDNLMSAYFDAQAKISNSEESGVLIMQFALDFISSLMSNNTPEMPGNVSQVLQRSTSSPCRELNDFQIMKNTENLGNKRKRPKHRESDNTDQEEYSNSFQLGSFSNINSGQSAVSGTSFQKAFADFKLNTPKKQQQSEFLEPLVPNDFSQQSYMQSQEASQGTNFSLPKPKMPTAKNLINDAIRSLEGYQGTRELILETAIKLCPQHIIVGSAYYKTLDQGLSKHLNVESEKIQLTEQGYQIDIKKKPGEEFKIRNWLIEFLKQNYPTPVNMEVLYSELVIMQNKELSLVEQKNLKKRLSTMISRDTAYFMKQEKTYKIVMQEEKV